MLHAADKQDFVPPQNLEAEESLIVSILLENDVIDDVGGIVRSEMFYKPAHQRIYAAMLELVSDNEPIDPISLTNKLKDRGELEACGGPTYPARLLDAVPRSLNPKHYAEIVRDKAVLRGIIRKSQTAIAECAKPGRKARDVIEEVQRSFSDVCIDTGREECTLNDLIPSADRRYRDAADGKTRGIETGYMMIDRCLIGMQPGDYILLAGRPSMGKTAVALNIAEHAASSGHVPAIFSFEMTRHKLIDRITAAKSRVPVLRFRTGEFEPGDHEKIRAARDAMSGQTIVIDDNSADIHYSDIRRRARKYVRKYGADFIIIDYLQLIVGDNPGKPVVDVEGISRQLKAMAGELNLSVMVLSQLNRKLEERSDKRPMPSDLRWSGALEQDADVILFLYREEVYYGDRNEKMNPVTPGLAEISIAKHRDGPTGMAYLEWEASTTRFIDIIPGYEGRFRDAIIGK